MCGIAGAIHLSQKPIDTDLVDTLVKNLGHRGPDNSTVARVTPYCVLGHTRLAIIDPSPTANQPMERRGAWLSYNGELYNYQDLITSKGLQSQLRTSSDTETLLELLISEQENAIPLLDGFFAFAFFQNEKLLLARDFPGKKPLYYCIIDNTFIFCSELYALAQILPQPTINNEVVDDCLRYRFSRSGTLIQQVSQLEPGNLCTVDSSSGTLSEKRFYDFYGKISAEQVRTNSQKPVSVVIDELDELLCQAVTKRLQADVPVGTVCSGGLDSSLVTAIAHRSQQLEILHVDVSGNSETHFAKLLARQLNQKLYSTRLTKEYCSSNLADVIRRFDFPLVHPNAIGIYALSEMSREMNIPVLLTGDGADELFGGYSHQRSFRTYQKVETILPQFALFKMVKLLQRLWRPAHFHLQYNYDGASTFEILLHEQHKKLTESYATNSRADYLAFLALDVSHYLQPLLQRSDRMGMAHGVELRSPFLDRMLMEYTVNLPANLRTNKLALKLLAERYLPKKLINRKKHGFPIPAASFGSLSNHIGLPPEASLIYSSVLRYRAMIDDKA
jgi:asparagine synthase (glutamine-hydrolysing)